MPCKSKLLKGFTVSPFGIGIICVGCAIVALVQNKALMQGAEEQAKKDGEEKDQKPEKGDDGPKEQEGEEPAPEAEADAPEEA